MQHLQPDTTLQNGKYRIERVHGVNDLPSFMFRCAKTFG